MLSILAGLLSPTDKPKSKSRVLAAEPLETREMLSAAGLVEIGSQPSGALDDKIVYVHGGHGIEGQDGSWGFQRPLLLDMVEDLGNQDQMSHYVEHLWNAGATVVPLRPVGQQVNEVVLDNDDLGVTFSGPWGNGSGSVYYGSPGDVRYGFATTSTVETAVATYRPDLPEAGFYPVYSWAPAGANRATDQLYRVHHAGGATEVTIDHSRVGNGIVYLGTYYFESGTGGSVEISNRSNDAGRVVVADMIRFGNGMGDVIRGGSVSGQPRENEASLYWFEWHADRAQGVPSSAYGTSVVSAAPRYATFMNQGSVGTLSDRVFVSFHSNAGGGAARGVLGLLNGNNRPSAATPNQLLLAQSLAQEVNDDLVSLAGVFERDWANRTVVTLDRSDIEFGEINNERINDEFDATIIETGFHDNQFDAQMLRSADVRAAIARSSTHGLVDYFRQVDGGATPNIDAPATPVGLSVETPAHGQATLSWSAGTVSAALGGAATGFRVYASTDGLAFDGGTLVPGGGTTTHTLTGLTAGQTYYFRIAAVNAGGESLDSEVVAVKPSASPERLLIVNGFDRVDSSLSPVDPFFTGADRARVRGGNTMDFVRQVAGAVNAAGATPAIATASNEAVASGGVDLADFDAVVWIAGSESSVDDSFTPSEQSAVAAYLSGGGKLFVSGAEIGWDLDNLNNGRSFYNGSLRADYVADDAGTYNATGVAGSIFDGLNLQFDDGSDFYNVEFPDVIAPSGGSTAALSYGGGAGTAAVQYENAGSGEQLVMLGFPFETLVGEGNPVDVMARVLDYFGFAVQEVPQASVILDNDNGAPEYTETGGWSTPNDPGVGGGTQRFAFRGAQASATWSTNLPFTGETEVFVQYNAGPNRASGVRYEVTVGGESRTVVIDQRTNDFAWVSLGQFSEASGAVSVTVDAEASSGPSFSLVIADQVRIDVRGEAAARNGDFNRDGLVDAADYTVYRDTLGQVVSPLSGADADGSGLVDAADRSIWLATYGQTTLVPPSFVAQPAIQEPRSESRSATPARGPLAERALSLSANLGGPEQAGGILPAAIDASLLLLYADLQQEDQSIDGEEAPLLRMAVASESSPTDQRFDDELFGTFGS